MSKDTSYDALIVGGGLSGMTLACLLGEAGLSVACIDQQDPGVAIREDLRTTAVSYGSQKVLAKAGIWNHMQDQICPINDIRVFDGTSPLLLDFLSEEAGGKAFGWIALNSDLRVAMFKRLTEVSKVDHIAPAKVSGFEKTTDLITVQLEDGRRLSAKLLIGADGRGSSVRDWMNVPVRSWSYEQRAVISVVQHENPHNNVAVEHFWPQGPFAILPMADDEKGRHRSNVVFTEHGPEKRSLMHFSDEAFEMALAARFPEEYGAVKLLGTRSCYPLGFIHAGEYTAERAALVADAAHGIHPIAGQGLNLGFRDVGALSELLAEIHAQGGDIGAPDVLARYERSRRLDNMGMAAFTDTLVRLFSNDIPPVRALRKAGLRLVSKIPPAKRFFMRKAMGE